MRRCCQLCRGESPSPIPDPYLPDSYDFYQTSAPPSPAPAHSEISIDRRIADSRAIKISESGKEIHYRTKCNSDSVYADAEHNDVLFFEEGDILEIIQRDSKWGLMKRIKDETVGYVPFHAMDEVVYENLQCALAPNENLNQNLGHRNDAYNDEIISPPQRIQEPDQPNPVRFVPEKPRPEIRPKPNVMKIDKKLDAGEEPGRYLTPNNPHEICEQYEDISENPGYVSTSAEEEINSVYVANQYTIQQLFKEGKTIFRANCPSTAIYLEYPYVERKILKFLKGDFLEFNQRDSNWYTVKRLLDGTIGGLPYDELYVTEEKPLESYDWFHGHLSREEAEVSILSNKENPAGTFLIRYSESNAGSFALEVLDEYPQNNQRIRNVVHYRISYADDSRCYIKKERMFDSLQELVDAYSKPAGGLHYPLLYPCTKSKRKEYDPATEVLPSDEIPWKDITLTEIIGSGSFGSVWKGFWKNKLEIAVKTLSNDDKTERNNFLKEAATLKKLNHKRLIKLFGVCFEGEKMKIVTELVEGGSLKNFLQTTNIQPPLMLKFAVQVADGMSYIEKLKLIHRDLAARNVLLDKHHNVKICDFGLAMFTRDYFMQGSDGTCMPIKWTALEGIVNRKFSSKSDVWGYGILLVELTSGGGNPYPEISSYAELKERLIAGYRHPQPSSCPDYLYELMLTCWKENPSERPSFEKIFEKLEKYIDDVDEYGGFVTTVVLEYQQGMSTKGKNPDSRDSGCVSFGNSSIPQSPPPPPPRN